MALVPRAYRPKTVIRRTAIKRGVKGGSVFWRALAVYFVGGLKMVRSQAILRGVMGRNRRWQVIGLAVLAGTQLSKQTEVISKEKVKIGQFVNVRVEKPTSRKTQKRTGITRRVLEMQALADVAAAKGSDSAT